MGNFFLVWQPAFFMHQGGGIDVARGGFGGGRGGERLLRCQRPWGHRAGGPD